MSTLLEQAIIDANALKEVALKNAQTNLIEKYSKEFKETVEKLLEQEEAPEAAPAPLPDVTAAPELAVPSEEPIKNVPSSFLDGDDDELITINFDEIKKQLTQSLQPSAEVPEMPLAGPEDQEMAAPEVGMGQEAQPMMEEIELDEQELEEMYDAGGHYDQADDSLSGEADQIVIKVSDEDEIEEEFELELEEDAVTDAQKALDSERQNLAREKGTSGQRLAQIQQKVASAEKTLMQAREESPETAVPAATSEMEDTSIELEEDFSITEEELSELAEELKIDHDPTRDGRGYMGTTAGEKKKVRDLELMAARDEKATKEREEEKKRFFDLQRENKALKLTIGEFKKILVSLNEAQEKQSVSNAKLLYTNKVLANTSLNERQKENIVESISRAKDVQEAKTIYETLQSAVQSVQSKEKMPKSLSEALNRGPSPFMARKPQVSQDDSFQERMRLLAGIKNN